MSTAPLLAAVLSKQLTWFFVFPVLLISVFFFGLVLMLFTLYDQMFAPISFLNARLYFFCCLALTKFVFIIHFKPWDFAIITSLGRTSVALYLSSFVQLWEFHSQLNSFLVITFLRANSIQDTQHRCYWKPVPQATMAPRDRETGKHCYFYWIIRSAYLHVLTRMKNPFTSNQKDFLASKRYILSIRIKGFVLLLPFTRKNAHSSYLLPCKSILLLINMNTQWVALN